ncbi:hypothetical protein ACR9YC_05120 [Parasphingorhabdus sp. DH2-15]|uniref:hypothetical protein n=1 Tax=Parasphingorhabdus sp. DH2-15 TaxID=3444112 RepID=UPI003F688EF1
MTASIGKSTNCSETLILEYNYTAVAFLALSPVIAFWNPLYSDASNTSGWNDVIAAIAVLFSGLFVAMSIWRNRELHGDELFRNLRGSAMGIGFLVTVTGYGFMASLAPIIPYPKADTIMALMLASTSAAWLFLQRRYRLES